MTNIRLYYFLIEVHLRVFDVEPDLPWSHDPQPTPREPGFISHLHDAVS